MKLGCMLCSFYVLINTVVCFDDVPVLVWGSGSNLFDYHVPAFKKLSTSDFHNSFVKQLALNDLQAIGLFVEESLSLEDLSSRNVDNKYAYPLLQSRLGANNSSKFLPSVSNPVKAFRALSEENYNVIENPDLPDSSKVVVVMQLDDMKDNEDRPNLIIRHDGFIDEACAELHKKYDKVVCVLTAKRPSWIESENLSPRRKLLEASVINDDASTPIYYFHSGVGLLYTKTPPLLCDKVKNVTTELKGSTQVTQKDGTALSIRYNTLNNTQIVLFFKSDNSTWNVTKVEYVPGSSTNRIVLEPVSFVGASVGNSFHSPSQVVFNSSNFNLTFNTLQIEYKATKLQFGPVEDTIYFFTIPILSGLFVSSLLVAIVLVGLSMIFDIKTMDQFDDPKGKSITINAAE